MRTGQGENLTRPQAKIVTRTFRKSLYLPGEVSLSETATTLQTKGSEQSAILGSVPTWIRFFKPPVHARNAELLECWRKNMPRTELQLG